MTDELRRPKHPCWNDKCRGTSFTPEKGWDGSRLVFFTCDNCGRYKIIDQGATQ